MLRTLYGKLAAVLLALLGFAGGAWLVVSLLVSRALVDEVNQKLNRDVARHLVDELPLMEGGSANETALKEAFHMMMVVNPSLEIYLLDPAGEILAYSADPGRVVRERVDLGPIEHFLSGEGSMPVLGDDPRRAGRLKAFSVAPVGDPQRPDGYLYVVLGGELYDSALEMFQGSAILKSGSAVLLVSLLVTLAAGLILFALISRRLRGLTASVETFQRSGFTEAPPPSRGRAHATDEIGRLERSFVEMASRLSTVLRELRQADADRRELVASVSHDLRTPLASLQGYLETLMLKEGRMDAGERRRYLEIAMRHGERLGRLIETLFELAKLESPSTRLEPEPFSVADLVQDISQKFQLEAERTGVRLDVVTQPEIPLVSGDIALIERVFENLLDNAIRHTPQGGEVTVSLGSDGRAVHVEVKDTGCGIPPESLPRVFERFYRVDRGEGSAQEGSGLGLAITRRILELHGSTIVAASPPGAGAAFRFDLPVHRLEGGPPAA